MQYATYTFSLNDTFENVASRYNVSVQTLANINNITGNIPKYISDVPQLANSSTILVPLIGNGGSTTTPQYYSSSNVLRYTENSYTINSASLTGSGGAVILIINGEVLNMPCYPKNLSDSVNSSFSSDSLFTSTEPYVVFSNSGPRQVSVSFQLHREMRGYDNDTYIDNIVNTIQAACYPISDGVMGVEVRLIIGKDIYIRGIINGSVNISYSGPIIDGKYNIVDIGFSIQEVYGLNMSYYDKKRLGGRVSI